MKNRILQFGSLLMVLVVLFVSMCWDVKFHYCTEEHQMMGSFGETVESCLHCLDHEHDHETRFMQRHEVQFDAKCCCEDFESFIQFSDSFVFSPDKHLVISLQSFIFPYLKLTENCAQVSMVFSNHSLRKTLKFLSGRERIVFFSSLKLNPLVF